MNSRIVIRRIGVISLAKIQGTLYALLGLIMGGIFSLIAMMGAAFMHAVGSGPGNSFGAFGAMFGVGAIIIFPILYGVFGFIVGLIIGALYNLVAAMVGGVELECQQIPIQ